MSDPEILLSPSQQTAFDQLANWVADPTHNKLSKHAPCLSLAGLAGTGKTTLIGLLARKYLQDDRVAFCAYTGKAASVLRRKLRDAIRISSPTYVAGKKESPPVYCGTIHGLIYEPPPKDVPNFDNLPWALKPTLDYDLIVVDEASMVGKDIWDDLTSFGIPLLLVGDHGQLPPIGDQLSLLQNPDIRLEEIHRQALGNPIIQLAAHVRAGGDPMTFKSPDERVRTSTPEEVAIEVKRHAKNGEMDKLGVLSFTNRIRGRLNGAVRTSLGLSSPGPTRGETLVCLRNHDAEMVEGGKTRCYNGTRAMVLEVIETKPLFNLLKVVFEDGPTVKIRTHLSQYGRDKTFNQLDDVSKADNQKHFGWNSVANLYDFGYCLTCHKAQGSQFSTVYVLECGNKWGPMEDPDFRMRWQYTAITRGEHKVRLIR